MSKSSVAVIPQLEGIQPKMDFTPDDEEQKRGVVKHRRLNQMYTARSPFVPQMERGLMLYDGIHLPDVTRKSSIKNDNLVAPYARIFVDAKTAEEVKAISEYTFTAVEDSGDSWKVELLKDVNTHVRRKIKQRSKRHDMLRMKNICGVSIARIGYRKVMGKRKIREETNDDGDSIKWNEREVPIYDDLFMEVVSPLNFLIDPNATTMDDAMDCAYFHAEHIDSFKEMYSSKLFKNVDKVLPGVQGTYTAQGFVMGQIGNFNATEDMVMICEYFNKILDEWVVYANGIEIYYGPLPDDHKELPFFSYHNNASFCTGLIEMSTRTNSTGEDVGSAGSVSADKHFWTIGDPATIMDLIELRTAHGRAAHRLVKRMSQRIIATRGNYRLPTDRNWLDGDPAPNAMGNVEILNMAGAGAGTADWQWAFDDLFQLMRLAIGVDPSNLAETKQKTATEAEIQRETALRRLDMGLEYNEENGEIRLGMIVHKLIQQRYTKPEIKRLLGTESEDEIQSFHDIEKDPVTGIPLYGKRYRRIKSNKNIAEMKKGGRFSISKDDAGVSSFLARPDYIRTSDIDIAVESGRKAAQLRSIESRKYMEVLALIAQLLPLTQADPNTGQAVISKEDLPNLQSVVRGLLKSMDLNPDTDMGQNQGKEKTPEEMAIDKIKQAEATRTPLNFTQTLPTVNA